MAYEGWTKFQDRELKRIWEEFKNSGLSTSQVEKYMSRTLGRSENAVRHRRYYLGLGVEDRVPKGITIPRFEDMPASVIEREWPTGRPWNWRRLVHQGRSMMGCSAAMCAEVKEGI